MRKSLWIKYAEVIVLFLSIIALLILPQLTVAIPIHSKNIALGKPYTLEPKPNHPVSVGNDNASRLTDGLYASNILWEQKGSVGWISKYAIITIDLGEVQSVDGVSYSTAAGSDGVRWPYAIYVLASDDGNNYYEAGELIHLSGNKPNDNRGYAVNRFLAGKLRTHGRYISFVVLGAPFIFADEIEVYSGEASLLALPFTGQPVQDRMTYVKQKLVPAAVAARIRSDIQAVSDLMDSKQLPSHIRSAIAGELKSAERELPNFSMPDPQNPGAVMPLNPLHERIFKTQAKLWRALGLPALSVWQSGLWDLLRPMHVPCVQSAPSVQVHMMRNEFRAGAFNISNASEEAVELRLNIEGLPGGVNPSYISVHQVAWTGGSGGGCIPAALPEAERADGSFVIKALPGLTRQVWLTFHPTDLKEGVYQGKIMLSSSAAKLEAPLTLHVYPFVFPDQPTLHLGGWDYTDSDASYDITPENRDEVIGYLREHFVDTPWGRSSVLPFEKCGANDLCQFDTTSFDLWMERWPNARQYCVFMSVGTELGSSKMGTPEFETKVKRWIAFWAKHIESRGLKPQQFALLLVDEPRTLEQDEIVFQWAKAIHAAGTGIKIWEDPLHEDPSRVNQEMFALCDVLSPERWMLISGPHKYGEYFLQRSKQNRELALYSCRALSHELDPYTYYRLQSWSCWEYGARSSYFWSFADAGGGSSWNQYGISKVSNYVPFFIDSSTVTTGKHMEAIREGIEDYEYLVILRDSIAKAEKHNCPEDILREARELLVNSPIQVCRAQGMDSRLWSDNREKDRQLADTFRIKILESLVAMRKFTESE